MTCVCIEVTPCCTEQQRSVESIELVYVRRTWMYVYSYPCICNDLDIFSRRKIEGKRKGKETIRYSTG